LELAEGLADRRVDGLIVLPLDPSAGHWRAIARATPTVSVNGRLPAPARSIRFASDRGIRLALDHLRDLGHERVLVLGDAPHPIPRRRGIRRLRCDRSIEAARTALRPRLAGVDRPTAVFALSDT